MNQAWVPDGFALGNLLYSMILAPGEEQRLIVREKSQSYTITDTADAADYTSENYATSQSAMGTQTKIAETIIKCEADYILQVKENQHQLYEDIVLYFKEEIMPQNNRELEKKGCYYRDYSGEHGRIEEREYYVVHDVEWLEQKKSWKNLSGIGMCHAKTEKKGETTESYSYAIFSREIMTAEEFGKGKRSHWGIENSLHWVLDIAYREDESRARKGYSAENLNIVRQLTLNMLKQERSCKRGIAGKRKNCGWDNAYLLKVLNTVER